MRVVCSQMLSPQLHCKSLQPFSAHFLMMNSVYVCLSIYCEICTPKCVWVLSPLFNLRYRDSAHHNDLLKPDKPACRPASLQMQHTDRHNRQLTSMGHTDCLFFQQSSLCWGLISAPLWKKNYSVFWNCYESTNVSHASSLRQVEISFKTPCSFMIHSSAKGSEMHFQKISKTLKCSLLYIDMAYMLR